MRKLFFILLLFPQLCHAAFPTGWGRKAEIIIQSSKVDVNLTAYVVLLTEVNLPSEMFDAGLVKSDGGDIRFSTDEAGATQIAAEIVFYDTTGTNACEIYFPRNVLSASNVSVWVWYDSASSNLLGRSTTFGSENVWDADYLLVLHMQEVSGSLIDQTSNNYDFTVVGSPTFAQSARFGDGVLYVPGGADKHERVRTTAFEGLGAFTMEIWMDIQGAADGSRGRPLHYSDATASDVWGMRITSGGAPTLRWKNTSSTTYETGTSIPDDTTIFNYHVAMFDDAAPTADSIYIKTNVTENIQLLVIAGTNKIPTAADKLGIGGHSRSTGRQINGIIDDIRFSKVRFSDERLQTQYNNQSDPATFALEQAPQDGAAAAAPLPTRRRRILLGQ